MTETILLVRVLAKLLDECAVNHGTRFSNAQWLGSAWAIADPTS